MRKLFDRRHTPTLVALSVPVLFIVLLAAALYLPGLFVKPKYDFLYTTDYASDYYVSDGRLTSRNDPELEGWYGRKKPLSDRIIYRYDVEAKTVHQLTFSDAQKLKLSEESRSPDGFELDQAHNDGGFLFYSSSAGPVLTGNGATYRLDGISNSYSRITLLGWVLED